MQEERGPHGQAVKTSPFHGGNSGSIPDGVTKNTDGKIAVCVLYKTLFFDYAWNNKYLIYVEIKLKSMLYFL